MFVLRVLLADGSGSSWRRRILGTSGLNFFERHAVAAGDISALSASVFVRDYRPAPNPEPCCSSRN